MGSCEDATHLYDERVVASQRFTKKGRWRMNKLLACLGKAVKGVLTGFDRIVFKGTILPLAYEDGAMSFLRRRGVLNRDYKKWMLAQTDALVTSVDRVAREQSGRPITHLNTWRMDKEELARKRQKQTGIETGLIGVWSCLESCWSYRARYCAEKGYPQLHRYTTQCKHLYLYVDHEQYGWMNELSSFSHQTPLSDLLAPYVHSRTKEGRRVRALDLSGKDRELLQAISDPSFTVSGITNAVLRKKLSTTSWGAGRTDRQLSARVSRHLRLLRDHGLIRKLPNRHRYHLTDNGRQLTTALHAMLSASTEQLLNMAA
jgi:hypothetical protein